MTAMHRFPLRKLPLLLGGLTCLVAVCALGTLQEPFQALSGGPYTIILVITVSLSQEGTDYVTLRNAQPRICNKRQLQGGKSCPETALSQGSRGHTRPRASASAVPERTEQEFGTGKIRGLGGRARGLQE